MKVITIDGPSAAGKGTIGAKLSQSLNCFYLDTGLLYRQIAAWVLEADVDLNDEVAAFNVVAEKISLFQWWRDLSATTRLRTSSISEAASKIGVCVSIRNLANQFQQNLVAKSSGWVVVDGRDAGTVVFPFAAVKLFVTAAPDVRAKRRYTQLIERGFNSELKDLEEEILQRDLRDQNRDIAPLKPAPDAYIIDTSEETAEESVQRVLKYLEKYMISC